MAVTIRGVDPNSPAEKAGLEAGMQLLSVDGHEIDDGLDYEFYTSPARLEVQVQKGEEQQRISIVKNDYQPLGCRFDSYLIDGQHSCRNGCVFCFIDQMPKSLRKSLYFKDDDERLSFLFGNYITLTNLSEKEIDRIIEMRIAPVNISVHTANPLLRVQMMKNKNAGDVLRFIPKLAAADIPLNCQLVLCPGLNDGEELKRSIEWLALYRPAVQSIAVVPVGLTKHRQGLCHIEPYTKQNAAEQLDIMLAYGEHYSRQGGLGLVYPADEWFLLAGRPIPPHSFYDDYPQLENGVGMWRLFHTQFVEALDALPSGDISEDIRADLATGYLAAPLLQELVALLRSRQPGISVQVHAVKNNFFGPGITVAGLLTGADLMEQLKGKLHSKTLLLPASTLRAEGDVMLDETTPEDLAGHLGVNVQMVPQDGAALLHMILDNH